jgi:hypothetical protein
VIVVMLSRSSRITVAQELFIEGNLSDGADRMQRTLLRLFFVCGGGSSTSHLRIRGASS